MDDKREEKDIRTYRVLAASGEYEIDIPSTCEVMFEPDRYNLANGVFAVHEPQGLMDLTPRVLLTEVHAFLDKSIPLRRRGQDSRLTESWEDEA